MCLPLDNKSELANPDRREVLDLMARGGLAAMLANSLPWQAASAADDETLRIGYLPITDATPLLVAYAKGFFDEQGIKVERPVLIRSWPSLVEGFASHQFNLVHLLKPIPIWMRYNNNIPVKIVAWCHTNGSAVVVGGQTGITSFEGCGGKQFAVPFWYSMHNIVFQLALRKSGLKAVVKQQGESIASNEVNLQVLPPPEMPAAMAARKIDGYIVAEPFNALGELRAGGKIMRFTGDIWKNHPCCVVTMHEEDLTTRQEWSQKVINAIVKAEVYASQNKREVAELLSRDGEGFLPVPAEVVIRAMTYYNNSEYTDSGAVQHADEWGNGRIDFQPYPYPSATEFIVKAMRETVGGSDNDFLVNLDSAMVAKDLVDYELVTNAMKIYPSNEPVSLQRSEIFAI